LNSRSVTCRKLRKDIDGLCPFILCTYLEHSYLGTDFVDVRVEQGYEIDRPSLLYLRASRDGDEIGVDVGGKVQMVARGELV
jgi:trans-2,3-dihydro-3-hydroxyanthranilate isomerase